MNRPPSYVCASGKQLSLPSHKTIGNCLPLIVISVHSPQMLFSLITLAILLTNVLWEFCSQEVTIQSNHNIAFTYHR